MTTSNRTIKNNSRKSVNVGNIEIGKDFTIICGPCAIESLEHSLFIAQEIKNIVYKHGFKLIFKSSFDKANRTSAGSYRGVGQDEGLEILSEIKNKFNLPVVTDIHEVGQVSKVAEVVDLLQIPAFLCRQTDLLSAAGASRVPTMIKKGQFLAPNDMGFAAKKVESSGDTGVLLCERGTCFGYRDLIVDFRSLAIMRELGYPVVFDATHSVQQMGGSSGKSGGDRRYVSLLAKAAVAVGVDALFLECHQDPDSAPSDGPNMLNLEMLDNLLSEIKMIVSLNLNGL